MAAKINQEKGKVIEDIVSQWGTLSAEHLALLKDNLTITHYKKNDIIYKDFENPKNTFCLISGKVKIFKDGIGRNQIVRAIKPIEFFGYRAHFAQEDYRTSAMAIEACTIASFPITILEKLMEENHQICLYLIHSLARELGNSDERTVNLTQKHIRGRLAEALELEASKLKITAMALFSGMIYTNRFDRVGLVYRKDLYGNKIWKKGFRKLIDPEGDEILNNMPPLLMRKGRPARLLSARR